MEQIDKLKIALQEMLNLHEKMLKCVDPRNTFYDAECITLMNTAPNLARMALDDA